jgi:LytR cell envelope-related transcriptional attenuator
VDAPLTSAEALVRPWRTATLVASLIAAVELVLLVGAALLLLAKPIAHAVRHHAEAAALAPAKKQTPAAVHRNARTVHAAARLPRSRTRVLVLNGNGRTGAASAAAAKLSALGYRIGGKGNAKRQDYATTVVMYRKGFTGEGRRLARDVHAPAVGPLDGLPVSALHGAQLVVVLGAR